MAREDEIIASDSSNMALAFLRAAEEVERIADALAADIEEWAQEYSAALRRRAYALSS